MHSHSAHAIRTLDRYYSIRVHHIKTHSPANCVLINALLLIALPTANHIPSCNLANPVDPVLTAFD